MKPAALVLPIKLSELNSILKEHGVVSASVFGSYARGEATPDSDLDILVAMDLGGLQYDLERRLNTKVDVATKLHPRFEPYITPDLVKIL
jgi:uncharacterized protein